MNFLHPVGINSNLNPYVTGSQIQMNFLHLVGINSILNPGVTSSHIRVQIVGINSNLI